MNQVQQIILGSSVVIIINAVISAICIYIAMQAYAYAYSIPNQTFIGVIFTVALVIVAAIGIIQLIYVIPIIIWSRRRERFALMKGVIIGAVITALVNGACYLPFLISR